MANDQITVTSSSRVLEIRRINVEMMGGMD
jgi:hypothetical protein